MIDCDVTQFTTKSGGVCHDYFVTLTITLHVAIPYKSEYGFVIFVLHDEEF